MNIVVLLREETKQIISTQNISKELVPQHLQVIKVKPQISWQLNWKQVDQTNLYCLLVAGELICMQ